MNLNLEKNNELVAEKGGILVFQSMVNHEKIYYLIIEDKPNDRFTLLNLVANNLMSQTYADSVDALLDVVKGRFKNFKLVGVIHAEDFELKRK